MTHTPGPWKINNDELLSTHGVYGDGFFIAEVILAEDAHLIAATPELLDALERILEQAEQYGHKSENDAARAAIAKAKGES